MRKPRSCRLFLLFGLLLAFAAPGAPPSPRPPAAPHVVLITVDTLRADHLSGYGYERKTSPNIDRLMARGVRFTQARTVVPLTCPALSSMLTTVYPHIHGSTRNGIRIREGLPSLPKALAGRGYATAAFVSNWTLQDRLCGLAEHFDSWEEILIRRRFLVSKREANADDVTDDAIGWVRDHVGDSQRPVFLWAHYMDPHFPYLLQDPYLEQLGVSKTKSLLSMRNRYDSEIAYVDDSISRLLAELEGLLDPRQTIVVFTSDHGESLGDHGYWGHGKHVYENGLHIPMSITWPGKIEPGTIEAPALLTDLASTIYGLLDLEAPDFFEGYDWTQVLDGRSEPPRGRVTFHQAHRGAVEPKEDPSALRRKGLLELGRIEEHTKEILRVKKGAVKIYDLETDRAERAGREPPEGKVSPDLREWLDEVQEWLVSADELPPSALDDEDLERLKALGYVD